MMLEKERKLVVEYGKKLIKNDLVKGTGGNLSVFNQEQALVAITPTGVDYLAMKPTDVVVTDLSGKIIAGDLKPSSEISFHLGLINLRPDIQAVVHTHSVYATTVACLGIELPALHYLIGFAGKSVPCAPYATYGTPELSKNICGAIGQGNAVLMANHGLVAVGGSLEQAFSVAEQVEYVARLYVQAKSVGQPVILNDEEMDVILGKFKSYGQQNKK